MTIRDAVLAGFGLAAMVGALVVQFVKFTRDRPRPSPGVAAAGGISGSSKVVDPDGDCEIHVSPGELRFVVPGTLHDLNTTEGGKHNAPRVLREVTGDFVAEVRLPERPRPGRAGTHAYRLAYHGAGLLIEWGDARTVRLEVAAVVRDGQVAPYLLFAHREAGDPVNHDSGLPATDDPIWLRLERKGSRVTPSYSLDGTSWKVVKAVNLDLPATVGVGVAAVNTAEKPMSVRLLDLKIEARGR